MLTAKLTGMSYDKLTPYALHMSWWCSWESDLRSKGC